MVSIAPCMCNSPGWAALTIPPPATSQASLSLLLSQLEQLFSQGPHLGKYMGQASISIPETIRKISIISTSNELSTTVNENNCSMEKKSKTNEQAKKHPVLKFRNTFELTIFALYCNILISEPSSD